LCAVKLFFGIPCPGCGLLHCYGALLHGDVGRAFFFFPIWPAFVLFFIFRRHRYAGEAFLVLLFAQWLVRIMFLIDGGVVAGNIFASGGHP
jgi:hypothetical protein